MEIGFFDGVFEIKEKIQEYMKATQSQARSWSSNNAKARARN